MNDQVSHLGASMRPPDLPGGNLELEVMIQATAVMASMRPPDLPGGNLLAAETRTIYLRELQ